MDPSGKNNIIPWQPVPRADGGQRDNPAPGGATGDRMLSLSWNNVVVQQRRLDATLVACRSWSTVAWVATTRVASCRSRARRRRVTTFESQSAERGGTGPDAGAGDRRRRGRRGTPTVTASITVPPDTALRVRTLLGKVPRTGATTGAAVCRIGSCGDVGFEAADPNTAPVTFIGGALVSQKVVDVAASTSKGTVRVSFRTTSETSIDGVSILAVGNRGETVVRTLTPQQGTTGVGADYTVSSPWAS